MEPTQLHQVLVRNEIPEAVAIDDEIVMMSIENGEYYGLNNIGSHIWMLFEKPSTPSEVIEALVTEYDADRETIERDLLPFMSRLIEKGLLRTDGGRAD